LCRKEFAKKIDSAVFPGLQGGPHNHTTAAKAVAFKEAMDPGFKAYAHAIVSNAKALAEAMLAVGFELVTGGTDNHLMLVDLSNRGISGRVGAKALNRCGIELNGNSIPFDKRKPFDPSGIRIGLAALTSRGMQTDHMPAVARLIDKAIREASAHDGAVSIEFATGMRAEVAELLRSFPAPGL
jgi:glycine hydroxymethyltransferase